MAAWPDLVLIAILPWVLLLLGSRWIYNSLWHDPWIYLGHMLNFAGHMNAFADNYAASRLSALLPGALVYRFLPPVLANAILHFGVYYVSAFSLYVASREWAGRRAALLAFVLFGTNFFVLASLGSDYVDAYVIAYFLLTTALLSKPAATSAARSGQLFAAGCLASCMVVANISSVILLPFLGVLLVLSPGSGGSDRRPLVIRGALFMAGGLVAFAVLTAIGYSVNGRWWLLQSQIAFLSSPLNKGNFFYKPMPAWLHQAHWLLLPALMVLLVPFAIGTARGRPSQFRRILLLGLFLAGLFLFMVFLHLVTKNPMVQFWFYSSWLFLPLSFLLLACLLGPSLGSLSPGTWLGLLGVALVVCTGSAVLRPANLPAPDVLFLFSSIGGVLSACFLLPVSSKTRVLAVALLLAVANFAAASGFRMRSGYPEPDAALADRWQEFEGKRAEAFSAIIRIASLARELAPRADVWFWFDIEEPLGPVFNAAACTHWWGIRIVSNRLPELRGAADMAGAPMQAGSKVLVLSADLGSARPEALSRLQDSGFATEILAEEKFSADGLSFSMMALRLLPR